MKYKIIIHTDDLITQAKIVKALKRIKENHKIKFEAKVNENNK